MKTEYRIIKNRTFIGDMYLQFKDTQKNKFLSFFGIHREKEVWRFVPQLSTSVVLGIYLYKDSCPVYLPMMDEEKFLSCSYEQENYRIIPFTKLYPDIEEYFKVLRNDRRTFNAKQRAGKSTKTMYL